MKALFIFILVISYAAYSYAADITLAWDANNEPDFAGYRVYYKTGSTGSGSLGLYDGSGLIKKEDVGDPNAPVLDSGFAIATEDLPDANAPTVTYSLSGIDEAEVYFFVVTAYDIAGNESSASNEVRFMSRRIIDKVIFDYKYGDATSDEVKQKIDLYMN